MGRSSGAQLNCVGDHDRSPQGLARIAHWRLMGERILQYSSLCLRQTS
jgi:hypothetical protein